MEKKLKPASKRLITTLSLYWFAGALSGLFVNIFIFKQTESFTPVVIFNLFMFLSLVSIYLASGYWLRKFSARSLIKLGIALLAIFYALFVILREKALFWILPLGLIKGAGEGLYWSGFNLHQYVHTQETDRDYYFGIITFWISVFSVIGPLIGGLIISWGNNLIQGSFYGYYLLFLLSSLVFALAFFQAQKYPRLSGISFKISDLKEVVKKNINFRYVLAQQGILGLKDASIDTIAMILAFIILTSEMRVGIFQSSFGLLAAIMGFIAGKMLTATNRVKLTFFSAIILTVGAMVFAIKQSILTLIVFVVSSVLGAFLNISLGTLYFSAIDEDQRSWQKKYAYFLARDGILGIGRVSSYLALWLLLTFFHEGIITRLWLAIAGSLSLIIWIFISRMKLLKTREVV